MSYDEWLAQARAAFHWEGARRVEFTEDGSAYAFCGGAYPLIFRNAVPPYQED